MGQRLLVYGKRLGSMVADAVLINVAVYLALYLRFDTPHIPAAYLAPYQQVAPWFTLATVLLFWWTRLYHRLWQYAGSRDAQVLLGAVVGSAFLLGALLAAVRAAHYPRTIYLLYALIAAVLVGGWRFVYRSYHDWTRPAKANGQPRILIVGAGKAGQLVAQELARHPDVGVAVGFLDDDEQKRGMQIASLKVLGATSDLARTVAQHRVDQVLFAIPSANGRRLQALVRECRRLNVKTRIIPALNQMIGGQVRVSQIRDVQIEDLLQREPTHIDLEGIAGYLTGRTVMVTGAGGTIGAELARQVAPFAPAHLLVLGMDETSIFEIDRELKALVPEADVVPLVADLRDRARIARIFERWRPQVIFHAAAHKHVPLMEAQPQEAITNNVTALWQLVDFAHRYGTQRFVFISTDKAVNPTSVYGCSKRIGELLVRAYAARSATRFVTVRFGNVLGSRGSVIPIFQEQIRQGGPVTVTHPEMVRYFMTVREAAELVIQAGAMATGGEVFVLDMGEPIRILDLATNLILLSGLRPGVDIDIHFTGVRPGEKLTEELWSSKGGCQPTAHERIFMEVEEGAPARGFLSDLEELVRLAEAGDEAGILRQLQVLVPEYRAPGEGGGPRRLGERPPAVTAESPRG